jgi:acetyl-CoA carboxylase biotin carboxyl carrier protein
VSLRYEEVAEILKIIDSSSCDEVIVETGDMKLVVRRTASGHVAPVAVAAMPTSPASAVARPATPLAQSAKPAGQIASGQIEVTAPMIGTFYRAPSPEAPPFVEIGTVVAPGQSLCIIEVMKLFTTIHSEVAGRVVAIGAAVGDLVEYGRTLFVIEPV